MAWAGWTSPQGRRKWLREAQRRLDDKRAEQARPVPRSRPERLKESRRRLEEELQTECQANQAYEAYRARGVMKNGRRFGAPPKPYTPPATPQGKLNTTDPDSRLVKGMRGWLQGYNAQAAVNKHHVVLACEVYQDAGDVLLYQPMTAVLNTTLEGAGITAAVELMLADAGYWSEATPPPPAPTG